MSLARMVLVGLPVLRVSAVRWVRRVRSVRLARLARLVPRGLVVGWRGWCPGRGGS